MDKNIELFENFRDLVINKEELNKLLKRSSNDFSNIKPIEVYATHVIALLEKYQDGYINEVYILHWVNTIWFSGWYTYNDENCDSIASVINELEEIDEEGKALTLEKVERYIHVLKENIELL